MSKSSGLRGFLPRWPRDGLPLDRSAIAASIEVSPFVFMPLFFEEFSGRDTVVDIVPVTEPLGGFAPIESVFDPVLRALESQDRINELVLAFEGVLLLHALFEVPPELDHDVLGQFVEFGDGSDRLQLGDLHVEVQCDGGGDGMGGG